MVELPKLLSASDRVLTDTDTDEDLRLLLAPGSSMGGARPKAAVLDADGSLAIAKFPAKGDEYHIELWSCVALALASKAGISIPRHRLTTVLDQQLLLITRFDRERTIRIPFLSAMSMIGADENQPHSYLELVDAIRQHGADVRKDLKELWRRILFSVLVSNVDDHLRNHGFLYDTGKRGWRLGIIQPRLILLLKLGIILDWLKMICEKLSPTSLTRFQHRGMKRDESESQRRRSIVWQVRLSMTR